MRRAIGLVVLACGLSVAGCAGQREHRNGVELVQAGRVDEGLTALENAVKEAPGNGEFRKELYLTKAAYIDQLLADGERLRKAGDVQGAEARFNGVLMREPKNSRALAGLEALVRDRKHEQIVAKARAALKDGDPEQANALLRPVLLENAEFPAALTLKRELAETLARQPLAESSLRTHGKPINLEFRDANVRMVFEALSRGSGINFLLDKDVRPDLRTSVFLKGTTIEDAIDLILQTSQLQKKILNANTVLIYPGTPEKLKEYQELVVKTFYLQNADAKSVQNTLKTLLKTKDLVIDEKLNIVMMRDTPEAIRLAEKLVAAQDKAEPEVMLEVEVIEVQRSRAYELGLQWPTQLSLTPLATGSTLTVNDLRNLNSSRIGATVGKTTLNLNQEDGDTNLLANPRIRVRNREKAKVMVGDKIPIITTTSTSTGFVADSVQYLDVGLKVELEPDIRLQNDIAIKVGLEVSSLGTQVTTASGTVAYQIGTRNANTVLRLKDGETQILAGLLNDEERASGVGIPGLSSIPIVGRLFGSREDSKKKTEIVLSITPRLIRNLQQPDADQSEFWSGSDNTLRTRPLMLQPARKPEAGKSGDAPAAAAEDKRVSFNAPTDEAAQPAQNVVLSWSGPARVKPGEVFKVALRLKADGVLRSLPFQAGFDPAVLQVVEVAEGEFFKQEDNASSFSSNVDANGGKLFVSASRTSAQGARGEGAAATVTLRALTAAEKSEIRLLAVSPIADGGKTPSAPLPAPYTVVVAP